MIRTEQLEDAKLKRLLVEKDELLEQIRLMTLDIQVAETEMKNVEKEIIDIEAGINIKDLTEKAEQLTAQWNELAERMEQIKKDVYDRVAKIVPKALREKYDNLKAQKEKLEKKRFTTLEKVGAVKNRILPVMQAKGQVFLINEYEGLENPRIEGDKVLVDVFSHLDVLDEQLKKSKEKQNGI